jgi:hypothetical protein
MFPGSRAGSGQPYNGQQFQGADSVNIDWRRSGPYPLFLCPIFSLGYIYKPRISIRPSEAKSRSVSPGELGKGFAHQFTGMSPNF